MAQEHRRGRKAEYTDRPLTEEEKIFAEEHHDFLYIYMRNRHLLGYSNTEICLMMEMSKSSYYRELENIRQTIVDGKF